MTITKNMIIGAIVYILFSALIFLFSIKCSSFVYQNKPDRDDYKYDECFNRADCQYRNKENPDKTLCLEAVKSCIDAMQLNRKQRILQYCKENTPEGMTENECRLYLK